MATISVLGLRKLEIYQLTHLPPPPCSDGTISVQVGNPTTAKSLVLVYHDESTFHANEGQSVMWAEGGRVPIRPKSQGRGIFVTEYHGLLHLSIEEYREASKTASSIRMCAREMTKFSAAGEGYWNNQRFLKQMDRAIKIAKIKYPSDKFTIVWLFDQSRGHTAFKDDALNVKKYECQPWLVHNQE